MTQIYIFKVCAEKILVIEFIPLYNIPGLRKAPPRQANNKFAGHGYQENWLKIKSS